MRPRAVRAWRHQWQDDAKRTVISLARTRSGYLLRFPRQCDFAISGDAGRIEARPHRRLAPEFLEHLLTDQVLPRCLAQQGELVVHAAGIALGPDIALFVGESGRGKSTLAGLFFRTGRAILSDDCLMLRPTPEAVRAIPTYPSLRLQPDSVEALFPGDTAPAPLASYSDKPRFSIPDVSRQAAGGRVAAMYFLGDADAGRADVRIAPMARATACIQLMEQCFQLDILDRDAVQRLLGWPAKSSRGCRRSRSITPGIRPRCGVGGRNRATLCRRRRRFVGRLSSTYRSHVHPRQLFLA